MRLIKMNFQRKNKSLTLRKSELNDVLQPFHPHHVLNTLDIINENCCYSLKYLKKFESESIWVMIYHYHIFLHHHKFHKKKINNTKCLLKTWLQKVESSLLIMDVAIDPRDVNRQAICILLNYLF